MSAKGATKRVNHTGRHRIARSLVSATIEAGDPNPLLTVSVDLSTLELPGDATVHVEAYRRTQMERFDLGTVDRPDSVVGRPLRTFTDPEGVQLRIKVVGTTAGSAGRLLAVADRLRPDQADAGGPGGRPLLRFRSDDGLGQLVWALDLSDDDPVVLMNDKLGDWNEAARTESFVTLVYPEILRQIAIWVGESVVADETLEGPVDDWARLLRQLGHDPATLDPDMDRALLYEWAASAAGRFARDFELADRASVALTMDGRS